MIPLSVLDLVPIREGGTLTEALTWLGPAEKVHVAGDPRLLERLAELPES